jgi:hypothetical protein
MNIMWHNLVCSRGCEPVLLVLVLVLLSSSLAELAFTNVWYYFVPTHSGWEVSDPKRIQESAPVTSHCKIYAPGLLQPCTQKILPTLIFPCIVSLVERTGYYQCCPCTLHSAMKSITDVVWCGSFQRELDLMFRMFDTDRDGVLEVITIHASSYFSPCIKLRCLVNMKWW